MELYIRKIMLSLVIIYYPAFLTGCNTPQQQQDVLSINDVYCGMEFTEFMSKWSKYEMQGKKQRLESVKEYNADEYYFSVYRVWLSDLDNIIKPYLLTWKGNLEKHQIFDKAFAQAELECDKRIKEFRESADYAEFHKRMTNLKLKENEWDAKIIDTLEELFICEDIYTKTGKFDSQLILIEIKPDEK